VGMPAEVMHFDTTVLKLKRVHKKSLSD